jgi:hypothetical protein
MYLKIGEINTNNYRQVLCVCFYFSNVIQVQRTHFHAFLLTGNT